MASVHAPSYIPPLTFEPFSLGEPPRPLTAIPPHSVPGDAASAYPPSSARIRGPRQRRKRSKTPVLDKADTSSSVVAQPQLTASRNTKSTSVHIPNSHDPLPLHRPRASTSPPHDAYARSAAAAGPSSLAPRLLDHAVPDVRRTKPGGAHMVGAPPSAGRIVETTAPTTCMTSTPIVHACGALLKDKDKDKDKERDPPQKPGISQPDRHGAVMKPFRDGHLVTEAAISTMATLCPSPAMASINEWPECPSTLSSRPASALPGETIDQLESLAQECRTMPHVTPLQLSPRVRSPRFGPRPCSPQSAHSGSPSPSRQAHSHKPRGSSVSSRGTVPELASEETAGHPIESSPVVESPEDVRWVNQYHTGSWCTSAKGKWKTAWIEETREEQQDASPINTHASPKELLVVDSSMDDKEQYYTYDPNNAPEFLVGASTSYALQKTDGFHSRRPQHRAPHRTAYFRHRPARLVLAPGFEPDTSLPDSTNDAPPNNVEPITSSTTYPMPTSKQFDMKGLELLIGPLEPRPSKSKLKPQPQPQSRHLPASAPATTSARHSEGTVGLPRVRKEQWSEGQVPRTAASWTPAPARRSSTISPPHRRRRNPFYTVARWFRRWAR